jgi:hypothetical protein
VELLWASDLKNFNKILQAAYAPIEEMKLYHRFSVHVKKQAFVHWRYIKILITIANSCFQVE